MSMRELVPWSWGRREASLAPAAGHDPFLALQRQIDDLFNGFARSVGWPGAGTAERAALLPSVDLVDDGDKLVLTAELPGMSEKEIELTLREGALVIQGEKREEREVKDKDVYRLERSYGKVHRAVPLPCAVKEDAIKASFKHGILTVKLPKQEGAADRSRRIPVAAG